MSGELEYVRGVQTVPCVSWFEHARDLEVPLGISGRGYPVLGRREIPGHVTHVLGQR